MHVEKQEILEDTWKHIPYKSQMNANGASTPQSQNQISAGICSPTVERGHITVKSVVGHLPKQEIWKRTSAFTLEKKFSSAQLANLKQQQNVRHLVFAKVWRPHRSVLIVNVTINCDPKAEKTI